MQQVADLTGLSVPFISQVENEQGNPTLSSLRRIASALETSVFALLAEDELREPVSVLVRKNARTRIEAPGFQYATYELLSSTFRHQRIQAVWVELAPGGASCEEPMPHGTWEAEEWVLIVEGEASLSIDGQTYELGVGDSIHFRPAIPHKWQNSSDGKSARFVSVMSPPSF